MNPELWHRLRATSRSFYLSLRVLPRPVRDPIGLAYLAARTTDTVADAARMSAQDRLAVLERMDEQLAGQVDPVPLPVADLLSGSGSPAERGLLDAWPETLADLARLGPVDLADVRSVLRQILAGQKLDLRWFGVPSPDHRPVRAFATADQLEHYTYCVAGAVGEFWSRVCQRHLFPRFTLDRQVWIQRAVRFGQGLQLVNILRDLATDLRHGRCYLPQQELEALGLNPTDLLNPAQWSRLKPCYENWRRRARQDLEAGWQYTLMQPRGQIRLNLACAWPLLLGARTLAGLGKVNPLDPAQRVKVPRSELRRWLLRSLVLYPWPGLWARLWNRAVID